MGHAGGNNLWKQYCPFSTANDRFLAKQGVYPNIVMELDSVSAVKKMVQENLGVTMLPERTIREENQTGSLVVLDIADGKLARPTVLVYPHHKKEDEAFQHFVQWIKNAY